MYTTAEPQRSIFTMSYKTILLQDPDVGNRTLVRRILSLNGYHVLEAANPQHAEIICRQSGIQIDLMIAGSAHQPLSEVRQLRPSLPIITLPEHSSGQCAAVPDVRQLQKQFNPEDLLSEVRSILDVKPGKVSILVIDDDQSWRNLVVELLIHNGYEAVAAKSREATKSFSLFNPAIVITEIVMEDAEGLQLIQKLVQLNPRVKVIAVTGSSRSATYLLMAKLLGARAALAKPLSSETLLQVIFQLSDQGPKQ